MGAGLDGVLSELLEAEEQKNADTEAGSTEQATAPGGEASEAPQTEVEAKATEEEVEEPNTHEEMSVADDYDGEEDLESDLPQNTSRRARRRIQTLAKRAKEAEEKASALEAQRLEFERSRIELEMLKKRQQEEESRQQQFQEQLRKDEEARRYQEYLDSLHPEQRAIEERLAYSEKKLSEDFERRLADMQRSMAIEKAKKAEEDGINTIISAANSALKAVGREGDNDFREQLMDRVASEFSRMERKGILKAGDPIPSGVIYDQAKKLFEVEERRIQKHLDARLKKIEEANAKKAVPPSVASSAGTTTETLNAGAMPKFSGGIEGVYDALMWGEDRGNVLDVLEHIIK